MFMVCVCSYRENRLTLTRQSSQYRPQHHALSPLDWHAKVFLTSWLWSKTLILCVCPQWHWPFTVAVHRTTFSIFRSLLSLNLYSSFWKCTFMASSHLENSPSLSHFFMIIWRDWSSARSWSFHVSTSAAVPSCLLIYSHISYFCISYSHILLAISYSHILFAYPIRISYSHYPIRISNSHISSMHKSVAFDHVYS